LSDKVFCRDLNFGLWWVALKSSSVGICYHSFNTRVAFRGDRFHGAVVEIGAGLTSKQIIRCTPSWSLWLGGHWPETLVKAHLESKYWTGKRNICKNVVGLCSICEEVVT
jgi:hypothetical protein